MKLLLLISAVLAVSVATQVVPIHELPEWREQYPHLAKLWPIKENKGDHKIMHGEEAEPHSIKHQVALLMKIGDKSGLCGGSVLSKHFVLTAAHCVDIKKLESITVVYGAHEFNNIEEEGQFRQTTEHYKHHEKWSALTLTNDLAIIRVPEPIEFNEYVQPINLPPKALLDDLFAGQNSTISGWGLVNDKNNTIADKLRVLHPHVMTNSACNLYFFGVIKDTHICTSSIKPNNANICSGDSGGPLTTRLADGNVIQIGIVSFGISLGCDAGWPASYTRVTKYVPWILENTEGEIDY